MQAIEQEAVEGAIEAVGRSDGSGRNRMSYWLFYRWVEEQSRGVMDALRIGEG